MNRSHSLYRCFNEGLVLRRSEPTKGGLAYLHDTTNHGTALLCGITELGYRSRKGLPLTCYWQGTDDPFWITEMLEVAPIAWAITYYLQSTISAMHCRMDSSMIKSLFFTNESWSGSREHRPHTTPFPSMA